MDFKLIDAEISSSIFFIYFTAICGEKTMRYEVAVVRRKTDKKKIYDEISTSISLKSMKYIVSSSLLNLMMAPE